MKIEVERKWRMKGYSIGIMYIDGVQFCNTLEDEDRNIDQSMTEANVAHYKVYGKTAIPYGTYRVDMDTISPKFKDRNWAKPYGGKLPRLVGVKGFSGVLIHVGNTADDTLGCILVGNNKVKGGLTYSSITFRRLMDEYLVPAALRGEKITITIKR